MAHRGRLNVLANLLRKPLTTLLYEFTDNYVPNLVAGDGEGGIDEVRRVGGRHVGKPGPEPVVVDPDERVVVHQVDVVVDHHQVARAELWVQAAAGVGDDQEVGSQPLHHPDGKRDLGERIALVGVHPPLHHDHRHAVEQAADELAGVAVGGRAGEVGDRVVGDRHRVGERGRRGAEAAAEDDRHLGLVGPPAGDERAGFRDLVELIEHVCSREGKCRAGIIPENDTSVPTQSVSSRALKSGWSRSDSRSGSVSM